MKNFNLLAICAIVILAISCKKEKQKVTTVYVAGSEQNSANKRVAKYWKNGQTFNVTDGNYDAVINDIYIDGKDVYLAGKERNSAGIYIAKYWKNGIAYPLSNGIYNAEAFSIKVVGNDVHVAGNEYISGFFAIYWKNGVRIELNSETTVAEVSDMDVIGNDVHIVGNEGGYPINARYWKNSEATPLSIITTNESRATAIYISGSDVYVLGYEMNGSQLIPKYWKNGVAVNLPYDDIFNYPTDIVVKGNDIHIVGYKESSTNPQVKYWKNGTVQNYSITTSEDHQFEDVSIAESDGDIYISATVDYDEEWEEAIYWKNGVQVTLSDSLKFATAKGGIFITKE